MKRENLTKLGITPRQEQILRLYIKNDSNVKATAMECYFTPAGVRYHLNAIRDATGHDPRSYFGLKKLEQLLIEEDDFDE